MKFFSKIKKILSFFLPFVFIFQWTLPTIGKKRITQINYGELVFVKCNNPEHSHPPLSKKKSLHEEIKFVNSEGNNLFFATTKPKIIYIFDENKFKKYINLSELSLVHLLKARGPPYFEV